jgi:hypothetical protein
MLVPVRAVLVLVHLIAVWFGLENEAGSRGQP